MNKIKISFEILKRIASCNPFFLPPYENAPRFNPLDCPYFLAARHSGTSFEEAYNDGTISHAAKRVYDVVAENDAMATNLIRQTAGFSTKEDKSAFDKALTELQMKCS